jgi:hypothetical protein
MSMKSIHEAVQKELELQQLLNNAIRQKEIELRQLHKLLLNALYLVNRLLDSDTETTEAGESAKFSGPEPTQPIETANLAAEPEATKTMGTSQANIGVSEIEQNRISGRPPRDIP